VRYGQAFRYFAGKPGGTSNLLYGSLALLSTSLIPILGQLVWFGYMAEVTEDLDRDPDGDFDDFTFDRFATYIGRGVWPFLAQLLVSVASAAGAVVAVGLGFLAGWALQLPWVGMVVMFALTVPLTFVTTMVTWPVTLHAQLSREFHFGRMARFVVEFTRAVGGRLAAAVFVYFLIGIPVLALGLLACCVGLYPAAVVVLAAQDHLMIQLYHVYLDEGGEPIGGDRDRAEADE